MRAPESMLTAEELRLCARKRRRRVLVFAMVLLFGSLTFFGARPTRSAIRGWQARRHAAKAFELIDQAKWNDARAEAIAAYQLRSTEPQALRAVARFLSRTRQTQALDLWAQLAKVDLLTREDLRDEAAIAMIGGELERAASAVNSLLANGGKEATPHDWLLAAQLRLQQGALEGALESLGKLFAQSAPTAREQFHGAILQLQSARTADAGVNQRAQSEAWRRLGKFSEGDDAVALDALVLLAQRHLAAPLNPADSSAKSESSLDNTPIPAPTATLDFLQPAELIRRLRAHPLAKAPHRLLAVDLELQANPGGREALISIAIAEWREADKSQLAVLATWLNGKGEYQRQLDEIPEDKALGSRELFLPRMDALAALDRWDEIKRLLESERFPLDQVVQRMYMARANAQLGNQAAARNNWQRALEAANGDAGKLMILAEYAEKNGTSELAETAYTQAAAVAPGLRAAWQGKLRMVNARRETKQIHAVLAEMLRLWPKDTVIQNDEAYTRLLLLDSVETNHALGSPDATGVKATVNQRSSVTEELKLIETLAASLVKKEPLSLPHRTLLALAQLKRGAPKEAMDVYKDILVPQNAASISALAVNAAVLAACGFREASDQNIRLIPPNSLLPEEQALLSLH